MPAPEVTSEEQRRKLITQLQQLRTSAGWKLLSAHLKELRAKKEGAIFNIGGNDKEYSAKDILIIERQYIEELLGFPEKLIAELTPTKTDAPENEDPFEDAA